VNIPYITERLCEWATEEVGGNSGEVGGKLKEVGGKLGRGWLQTGERGWLQTGQRRPQTGKRGKEGHKLGKEVGQVPGRGEQHYAHIHWAHTSMSDT
jgi:hypothetical protein